MSGTYPNLNEVVSPSSVNWGLEQNSFIFESFSNVIQAAPQVGSRWRGEMTFDLTQEEVDDLELFVEGLGGRSGRFCVMNPRIKTYPALGTPNVNAPNQLGRILTTQGWLPNRLVLRRGQYFNIGNELKRSTADVYSSATGTATINFYPSIRIAPALNLAINTQAPFMLASLDDDYNPTNTTADLESSITLTFTEAIYERG